MLSPKLLKAMIVEFSSVSSAISYAQKLANGDDKIIYSNNCLFWQAGSQENWDLSYRARLTDNGLGWYRFLPEDADTIAIVSEWQSRNDFTCSKIFTSSVYLLPKNYLPESKSIVEAKARLELFEKANSCLESDKNYRISFYQIDCPHYIASAQIQGADFKFTPIAWALIIASEDSNLLIQDAAVGNDFSQSL